MRALALLLLVFLIALPSCEGEEGPVGPEGPPGSGLGFANDPSPGYGSGLTFDEAASVTFDVTENDSKVFIVATDNVWGAGTACFTVIRLVIDDVVESNTYMAVDVPDATGGGNNMGCLTTSTMVTLSQGTHTVKLERGGCSFDMNPHLNIIVLGN